MKLEAAKCPQCGADIQVDASLELCTCAYCGSRIIVQGARGRGPAGANVAGTAHNPVFEAKLANANNWAKLYFDRGPKVVKYGKLTGFDAVMRYYGDAELVGAHESRYWIDVSRFFVKGNLEGFKSGIRYLKDKTIFINHYIFLMDNAINRADEDKKDTIIAEKEETVRMLNDELSKYPEKKRRSWFGRR